jgi:hypothetical protein
MLVNNLIKKEVIGYIVVFHSIEVILHPIRFNLRQIVPSVALFRVNLFISEGILQNLHNLEGTSSVLGNISKNNLLSQKSQFVVKLLIMLPPFKNRCLKFI